MLQHTCPLLFISCLFNMVGTFLFIAKTFGYIYITPISFPPWMLGQQEVVLMLRKLDYLVFQHGIDSRIKLIHAFCETILWLYDIGHRVP